jgi:uncharacterized membrane protein
VTSGQHRIALVLILLGAAALRLHGIGRQSLWFDEAATVHIVGLPFGQMMERIKSDERTPPLHYAILYAWTRVFGNSEVSVRLPSAIAGTATVAMLYLLVRELFGVTEAALAALMLALSRYQINYSQEARAYSLLLLMSLWSCYLFARLMRRPTWRAEVAYLIVTALLLYTHLYGVFTILAQHVAYFIEYRTAPRTDRIPPRQWLLLNAAVLTLFVPWIPTAVTWTRSIGGGGTFWVKPMTPAAIAHAYRLYAGSWIALILLLTLAIVALWRRRERFGESLFIALAAAPVAIPVIVSSLGKPTFTDRYGITAPAGLFALVAAGLGCIPWRTGQLLCLGAICGLLQAGNASEWDKPDWRGAGAYLTANLRAGDVAVINRKIGTYLYDYYVHRADTRRIGFDSTAVPGSFERVWLIVHSDVVTPQQIIERGRWRVLSHRRFGSPAAAPVDVLELQSAEASTPPAPSPPPSVATPPTTRSP